MRLLELAPAKLNITFSIGEKEENGYHLTQSLMQAISLFDYITVETVEQGQEKAEGLILENDLIRKAIGSVSQKVGKPLPCRIVLQKVIPMSAGLGGGSSDAATIIRTLNCMFRLGLSMKDMEGIAGTLGADVPFFLHGGRAFVEGGKCPTVHPLKVPQLFYLIAHPHISLSTAEMYNTHDATGKSFVELASERCPDILRLLKALTEAWDTDPVESGMTGKGPTVFAGYNDYASCLRAINRVNWFNGDLFIARPITSTWEYMPEE